MGCYLLSELIDLFAGKRVLALTIGSLMLLVILAYSGQEVRRHGGLRPALGDRNFWDSMVLLLFIVPGPLIGLAIALIT